MNRINYYLAKNFLIRFLQIFCGFSLLIFFINFMETMSKMSEVDSPFYISILLAFLQIPDFLNDVVSSLVLIATIVTFFTLSSRSEVTIIRISGFSLWQIVKPVALTSFALGIFWITIFDILSIKMGKEFQRLESKYLQNESREALVLKDGIWLKQANVENPDEELVILSQKFYRDDLEFSDVTVWFFNKQGEFYKKIDAKKAFLKKGSWSLDEVTTNDPTTLNNKLDHVSIPTDLEADFVIKKIVNNLQSAKIFSIFELPGLIQDLAEAGFSPTKFKIYFHSLLAKPLLFSAMSLIACYFSLNHIRNQNTVFLIICGVVLGLVLYITSSIINALGASGLIPIFASTWLIAVICLSIGILLIYQKESF
ncbi:MAG: LptF/LptG family permease [Proteobacteria bacterium]|nr:LptF/LptG family permease [Pseudomonadota bacterium]